MSTVVVVEGPTDAAVLRALLPAALLETTTIVAAGGRSSLASVARTLLVTHRKPVAVLFDSDSRDEAIVRERVENVEELLTAVAGNLPVRVIPLVPAIESLVFEAPGVIERVFGTGLPENLRLLAQSDPKSALAQLLPRGANSQPLPLSALLGKLEERDFDALRSTRPMRDLISFLTEPRTTRHLQRA